MGMKERDIMNWRKRNNENVWLRMYEDIVYKMLCYLKNIGKRKKEKKKVNDKCNKNLE